MTTLTLEIPDELDAALQALSAKHHLSKSDVVRELLERGLGKTLIPETAADRWLEDWRGQLKGLEKAVTDEGRLSHLLDKHLR